MAVKNWKKPLIENGKLTKYNYVVQYPENLKLGKFFDIGTFTYINAHYTVEISDDVQIGEKVIAIGNPLGLSFSVSEGIVSAVNREGSNGLPYYIQTDTALNPGNSGGPLINTDGEVIGINNFKIAGGENLGFSLESNYIEDSVNEISLERLDEIIL